MKNQPLQRQFRLWTILVVIVPSLLIMGIYTVDQIKEAKQQNLALISQRVYSQERLIEYWMAERAGMVRRLSQFEPFRTLNNQQMQYALDFSQQGDMNFDSLSYINKDGWFTMSTLSSGIWYPSASGQPYFEAAQTGREYISDVVIGRNSGQPIINFSSPIYDYDGNFQGLILGSVRTATLEALLRENWIGQTGEIFLVNHAGVMLTEPRFFNVLVDRGVVESAAKMKLRITDDALHNIQLGKAGTAAWVDYLGNRVLGAYLDVPERGWTIIGKINEAEVLTPIYRQLVIMAGSTSILVLLILPLATLVTGRMKHSIDWLIGQSNLVAAERYEMVGRGEIPERMPRELGELCETFVKMSRKIENTVGLLKVNEAKLESKVLEIQDVNQRLEKEIEERRKSETDNRALIESIPDVLLRISAHGRILSARANHRSSLSIFGETRLGGQSLKTMLPESVAELYYVAISQALIQGELQRIEYDVVDNAVTRYREARIVPTRDDTVLAVIRDVTEQRKTEDDLAKMRDAIVNAQRMASLGIMAGSIAHEINQPLNSIKVSASGMLYLMQEGALLGPEDFRRELTRIVKETERIDHAVSKTRWIGREGLANRNSVLIDEALLKILALIKDQDLFKNIKIDLVLAPRKAWIAGNQTQIEQILLQLLTNAAQALHKSDQQEKAIAISVETTDKVIITIADNGPGLEAGTVDKIFEPFFTTNNSQENMGLGLAIVQSITYAHGGEIIAENNWAGGATFRMLFPVLDDCSASKEEPT